MKYKCQGLRLMIISFQLMNNIHFKTWLLICSLFVVLRAQEDDHDHEEDHEEHQGQLSTAQAWGFGILAGIGVSLIGLLAAILVVIIKKCLSEPHFKFFLNLLYSLGCGAMVGDAMVHILPQAYVNEEVHSTIVSLIFIIAIFVFIIIERAFVYCGVTHQHWEGQHSQHGHNEHSHKNEEHKQSREQVPEIIDPAGMPAEINLYPKTSSAPGNNSLTTIKDNPGQSSKQLKVDSPVKTDSDESETEQGCLEKMKGKGTAGYLNLISSFIHNFFDGFAVGAAFASRDKDQYIPVLIAVFAHEIPRQMGDVGILMKNKFDSCQTIFWNAIINTVSLLGVVIGLALGGISEAVQTYILVFVAGNFIYIGADIWRNLLKNNNAFLNIMEFISFSVGVGAMFLVLLAENSEQGHNH